jgi:nucleoid-associated protein YgaU
MVAALQAPPRVRSGGNAPARVVPLRSVPDGADRADRVVIVHRQPRPRAARCQSAAVYWRRRLIAAALGLGIVLTAARAGVALGGSTTFTPGRSPHPHVEDVVVRRGDTLWSIAERVSSSSDPRALVDALAAQLGTSDLQVGERIAVPVS